MFHVRPTVSGLQVITNIRSSMSFFQKKKKNTNFLLILTLLKTI